MGLLQGARQRQRRRVPLDPCWKNLWADRNRLHATSGSSENSRLHCLDEIESFFFDRGAAADHEISPLAGVAVSVLLCRRNYRPIEISSVLYRGSQCIMILLLVGLRLKLGATENH